MNLLHVHVLCPLNPHRLNKLMSKKFWAFQIIFHANSCVSLGTVFKRNLSKEKDKTIKIFTFAKTATSPSNDSQVSLSTASRKRRWHGKSKTQQKKPSQAASQKISRLSMFLSERLSPYKPKSEGVFEDFFLNSSSLQIISEDKLRLDKEWDFASLR